mmetsp:Transcript_172697/g.548409  ORF Transcript_172697/g.548409 Transcript_172697/m.548409 type:complete len:97 (+) Transcript_172697:307-597(+)
MGQEKAKTTAESIGNERWIEPALRIHSIPQIQNQRASLSYLCFHRQAQRESDQLECWGHGVSEIPCTLCCSCCAILQTCGELTQTRRVRVIKAEEP